MAKDTDSAILSNANRLSNSLSLSPVESVLQACSKFRQCHEEGGEEGRYVQVTNTVVSMPLPSGEWQRPVDPAAPLPRSRTDLVDWIDELPSPPNSSYNPFTDNEPEAILAGTPSGSGHSESVAAAAKNPTHKKISGSWSFHAPRIAAQNALARSKSRFSVHKSIRERAGQKQPRQTARGMRPRIFVNTNFSRRQARPNTGREGGAARIDDSEGMRVGAESSNHPRQYANDVNEFKQAYSTRAAGAKQVGEAGVNNTEETSTEAGPITNITHLSPYSTTKETTADRHHLRDGLSPYDRAILIGISMAAAQTSDERPPIPRGNYEEGDGRSDGKLNRNDPLTPTIVITPAREALISSPSSALKYSRPRPRAASSVYSRRFSDPFNTSPKPTPARPALTRSSSARSGPLWRSSEYQPRRDSWSAQFQEDHPSPNRSRHASTYTVFEEDDPSPASRMVSSWEGSPTSAVHRSASMEDRRPQSKGWWNYITTPFLTQSNTKTSTPWNRDQDRPPLPGPAQAAAVVKVQERADNPSGAHLPPPSPAYAQRKGHETIWADFSRWEEDRNAVEASRAKAPSAAGIGNKESPIVGQRYGLNVPRVAISRPDQGQAAATSSQSQGFPWGERADAQGREYKRSSSHQTPATGDDPETPSGHDMLSPNDREVPMLLNNTSPPKSRPGGHNSSGLGSDSRNTNFREPHIHRSDSNFTEIFGDASPTVHQANIASVVRAGFPVTTTVGTSRETPAGEKKEGVKPETHRSNPPPYSPPRALLQPERIGQGLPLSSGTNSSQGPHRTPGRPDPSLQGRQSKYLNPRRSPQRPNLLPVTLRDLKGPTEAMRRIEAKRQRGEKEDAMAKKVGSLWRGRACLGKNGCFGRGGVEARKRRRWCAGLITGIIMLLILILSLALALPRKRKQVETEPSKWANITGWPPIPTGVSTIVQPDLVQANTGCVFPSTMWSCALPKEVQKANNASGPDQPNLRFEIRYLPNLTSPTSSQKVPQEGAASFAFPEPPSVEDQRFMGNTTDNVVSALKEGEESPFSMAFLADPPSVSSKQVNKLTESRHRQRDPVPFPDIAAAIPRPEVDEDGTAKPANLLPVSLSQTLRLYDRGLDSEHYGFYVYFDRSIFLKSTSLLNQSDIDRGPIPDDLNGGSSEREARARCTWAQTRFLVQIWTKRNEQNLLRNSSSTTAPAGAGGDSVRPGSFPFPVSITTDRHGGDITKKMIYCYGLDARTKVIKEEARIQIENRGFGGKLVGGGQGPLGRDRVTLAQGGMGGIDGGTGGCACRWKNFIDEKI